MIDRITQSIKKFMYGRAGVDKLTYALLIVALLANFFSMLMQSNILNLFYFVALVLAIYRTISKNIQQRNKENYVFENLWATVVAKFMGKKKEMEMKKIYCLFKCPRCSQKLRMPKNKGTVVVVCSKCKCEFQQKT